MPKHGTIENPHNEPGKPGYNRENTFGYARGGEVQSDIYDRAREAAKRNKIILNRDEFQERYNPPEEFMNKYFSEEDSKLMAMLKKLSFGMSREEFQEKYDAPEEFMNEYFPQPEGMQGGGMFSGAEQRREAGAMMGSSGLFDGAGQRAAIAKYAGSQEDIEWIPVTYQGEKFQFANTPETQKILSSSKFDSNEAFAQLVELGLMVPMESEGMQRGGYVGKFGY